MTYLPANVMGRWFHLYLILDLYSPARVKVVVASVMQLSAEYVGWWQPC